MEARRHVIMVLSDNLIKEIKEMDTLDFAAQTHTAPDFECLLISSNAATFARPAFASLDQLKGGGNV